MRIYIESTIPSYVVARPARDLLQAARQQLTKDWWDLNRAKHELFTSQVALDEITDGEAAMAQQRLDAMAQIKLLEPPHNPGVRDWVEGKRRWSSPPKPEDAKQGFRGWNERGYLPHRDEPGLTQFVTFRLADVRHHTDAWRQRIGLHGPSAMFIF